MTQEPTSISGYDYTCSECGGHSYYTDDMLFCCTFCGPFRVAQYNPPPWAKLLMHKLNEIEKTLERR